MSIRTTLLIELLNTFPADAIVRGFADGLTVTNADGTVGVVLLNDGFGGSSHSHTITTQGLACDA
jgi:hypothetical protein